MQDLLKSKTNKHHNTTIVIKPDKLVIKIRPKLENYATSTGSSNRFYFRLANVGFIVEIEGPGHHRSKEENSNYLDILTLKMVQHKTQENSQCHKYISYISSNRVKAQKTSPVYF